MTGKWKKTVPVWIIICLGVGWMGSIFTRPSIEAWYVYLNKPVFTPPSWVFAPVWTLLYVMIGIAAGIIWSTGGEREGKKARLLFIVQLALNVLWSPAFFGLRWPLAGLVVIVPLAVYAVLCLRAFLRLNKAAGFLMLPYLLWLFFAMVLNASIVILN